MPPWAPCPWALVAVVAVVRGRGRAWACLLVPASPPRFLGVTLPHPALATTCSSETTSSPGPNAEWSLIASYVSRGAHSLPTTCSLSLCVIDCDEHGAASFSGSIRPRSKSKCTLN